MHESFIGEIKCPLMKLTKHGYSSSGAISHRNGKCGYKNKVDLFPSYSTVEDHIRKYKTVFK